MEMTEEKGFVAAQRQRGFMLDPRTKLLLMIFVATLTLTGEIVGVKIYFRLLLALLPGVLLSTSKTHFKQAMIYTVGIAFGWLIESFLVNQFTGIVGMILLMGSGIITRFLPSLMMGYYFISTTQVDELIAALQKWHIPVHITIPLAVMFRFIPTIQEESSSIKDAMRMRDVNGLYALKSPIKYVEYRFVPLMSSIVRIGDDLSAAALTRGLGGQSSRTSIHDVAIKGMDYLVLLISVAILSAYFWL